jgi:hypothetical protein
VAAALSAAALASAAGASAQDSTTGAGALTLRFKVGPAASTESFVVVTNGPAPKGATFLVDESGDHRVVVTTLGGSASECLARPVHYTSQGTDRWCVQLAGVAAGHTYKGALGEGASKLTLMVTAKHGLLWPAIATAAALAAAVAITWIATAWLPDNVTKLLLHRALRDNGGIRGLSAWGKSADGRISPGGILARVRWAKRHGKRHVLGARADLAAKLAAASSTIPVCPLRTAGEREAGRAADDIDVAELLRPGGDRATSPAEELLALVERADESIGAFSTIAQSLLARFPPENPNLAHAKRLVEDTPAQAKGYLSEFTIDGYENALRQVLSQLQQWVPTAIEDRQVHMALVGGAVSAAAGAGRAVGRGVGTAARGLLAAGAVGIFVGLLMVSAVVVVLATKYAPNATFGTGWDYFDLVATALASSSAAGIVSALLLLRGPEDWFG